MLALKNIHTYYGNIEAVKGVDIIVNKGEIVCLIGANGAGKSTTLMTISGILKPNIGSIIFNGQEIHNIPPHMIVEKGISQVPEGRRIFPRLTVRENLEIGAYPVSNSQMLDGDRKCKNKNQYITGQLEKIFHLFPVLMDRQKQPGGTLSGGEQQMLAIGRALMSKPKLLLFDEPSLGLAPIFVAKIFRIIKELYSEGLTILLVEQNAKAALSLAHRGYVLESGRITMEGRGTELINDPHIRKAYLGE